MGIVLVAAIVLVLDRASKLLVQALMVPYQSVAVIPDRFHLTLVYNPGAAFGLLPNRTTFFVVVTVMVVAAIALYAWKVGVTQPAIRLALGLQLGGALGNLFDRLWSGAVIDFLDFRIWPVFNLADTAIVSGVALFSLGVIRGMVREGKTT